MWGHNARQWMVVYQSVLHGLSGTFNDVKAKDPEQIVFGGRFLLLPKPRKTRSRPEIYGDPKANNPGQEKCELARSLTSRIIPARGVALSI